MEHQRDRKSEKRRDLARSTCSPAGGMAHAARKAKRNANRRWRRAQKAALIAVRKAPCLCDDNAEYCPRCDMEMSHFDVKTSRPKAQPWWHYNHCYEYRWEWDKFSQMLRWAHSLYVRLCSAELMHEIRTLGRSKAQAHAIFHLLMSFEPSQTGTVVPSKMTVAALTSTLRERGVPYCDHPERLLARVAERVCTHGKFDAANKWSFELCHGLGVDARGVRNQWASRQDESSELRLRHLDDGWCMECAGEIIYRPLRGIQDAAAWAAEIQRLFDVFWGQRFLNTPEGRWVIGELVTTAIPKLRMDKP